ncbi:MAG TPA: AAA family ATPase, partial [Dehalococcoidia bacterium]|nr:AAA family ATPase [Dehalococcoidia bacterium]
MRLRRIDLPGFGCLAGFRAEFSPGVNVFFGDNEAGKSTLQQAVCALLYGFFDGDRARPDETARHERFRPWPDGRAATPYRGSLEYELEDGRAFEVRRDFSSGDVPTQLIDLVTGADVASQYGQGRHGNVPFARKQAGMSRAVFQSCAFIGQGEVMEVSNGASPREIGDAIAALADSSRRDVSAKAAIDRLNILLQKIGSDRARTAELPSAREALGVAEAELAALETAQRAVAQSAADLRTARERLDSLERDVVRGQVLFLKARGASLERKLKELAEADAALERAGRAMSELAGFAGFPVGQRDAVLRLRDRLAAERNGTLEARRALEDRRDRVPEAVRLEFEALRSSVGALSDDSIRALRAMAYATAEVTAQRPNLLSRLWRGVAGFVAALLRVVLRRVETTGDEEQPPAPAMSREEAQALLERHTRYLTLRPDVEALAASEARLRTAEAVLASTEDELRGVLATATAAPGRALDEAVADFLEGCRKHTLYEVAEAESEEAARRRRLLLGDKSPDELRGQSDECDRRLAGLLAANPELAGVEPDTGAGEIAKRLEGLQAEGRALEV